MLLPDFPILATTELKKQTNFEITVNQAENLLIEMFQCKGSTSLYQTTNLESLKNGNFEKEILSINANHFSSLISANESFYIAAKPKTGVHNYNKSSYES